MKKHLIEERKRLEADFHNQREIDRGLLSEEAFESKYSNKKYYCITRRSRDYIKQWLRESCQGKVVLDYCCGLGGSSLEIANCGAFVYGIDISNESIETATEMAAKAGLGEVIKFSVMDAENMNFWDNMFDIIYCSGVLHHLDLNRVYPELARVLKPSGRVICQEALGYNPIINLYRRMTPRLRTVWEAEHILTMRGVQQSKGYFKCVSVKFFHLVSILAVPFRKTSLFNSMLTSLELIDSVVLSIPFLRRLAWQIVFILSEPKK